MRASSNNPKPRRMISPVTCRLFSLLIRLSSSKVQHGQDDRPNGLVVKDSGPHKLRMIQPNQKGNLEVIVKGNKASDKANSLFNDRKGGKDNPVGQPLNIVRSAYSVECFEGHVCRIQESGKVDHQLGTSSEIEQS